MVHIGFVVVNVSEAKGRLTDLVRRAEDGEDVVLTRHGHAVARIVPVAPERSREKLRAVLEEVQHTAKARASAGPSAARSQDFLYDDETGLP